MNAIKLLKKDHDKVKDLFREYESSGERAYQTKQQIADQIFQELEVHASIEEEIFYPAIRSKGGKEGKEVVAEAVEEHNVVKTLISELRSLESKEEEFEAKMKVLMENVEHHIEEEEDEMFSVAKEELDDELDELGIEMESRKEDLSSGRPLRQSDTDSGKELR